MNRKDFEKELLSKLSCMWINFTESLPSNFNVENALDLLVAYRDQNASIFINFVSKIMYNTNLISVLEKEDGMNSPGILWDRLTILNCKLFFTSPNSRHFNIKLHNYNTDVNLELSSVLNALHLAKPAKHILLAKEATERQNYTSDLGFLLWQLQYSNLAMWINQDLLYTVNVECVDELRLRNYIKFFSEANKLRNVSIEKIEIFYEKNLF